MDFDSLLLQKKYKFNEALYLIVLALTAAQGFPLQPIVL